jgi:hypothetical protein
MGYFSKDWEDLKSKYEAKKANVTSARDLIKNAEQRKLLKKVLLDKLKKKFLGSESLITYVDTKKDIGKADGYSRYMSRSGAANFLGQPTHKMKFNGLPDEMLKDVDYETQIMPYIAGFQKNTIANDIADDPLFVVFDLQIETQVSPLFRSLGQFITDYSDSIPELDERFVTYYEFIINLITYIPQMGEDIMKANKLHYIQSISGLDNLYKKIVDYPKDKLTFTVSDDITMSTQQLAELYNNLVYSYDTHRYLIPENLLRFDLRIMFNDIRTMKDVDYKAKNPVMPEKDETIFNKSKFIYILHDCMFDFSNSRNFKDGVVVGGWGASIDTNPATLTFDINYKSISKITAADISPYSNRIDFRKREDVDYQTPTSYTDQLEHEKQIHVNVPDDGLLGKVKDRVKDELMDVRGVLLNNLKQQTQKLVEEAQQKMASLVGFSVTKFNVYIDSPANVLDKASIWVDNKIKEQTDKLAANLYGETKPTEHSGRELGSNVNEPSTFNRDNNNGNNTSTTDRNLGDNVTEPSKFNRDNGDNIGTADKDLGSNVAEPSKFVRTDPQGDVFPNGTYNEKYPEGDVFDNGKYNEKYPDGVVFPNGTYNQKYPEGDVFPNRTYNEKYPDGDVFTDGTYNEKYPTGDVFPNGTYNQKYPEGDVFPNGTYNEKLPNGKLMDSGTYNQKLPSGDVFENGKYNQKLPNGSVYDASTTTKKEPIGKVYDNTQTTNKQPIGKVYEASQLTIKFPDGDVFPDVTYNEKYPDGDVFPDGTYNEKYPEGSVSKNGQYNLRYPDGNLYIKTEKKEIKPVGNIYKKK